MRPDYKYWTIDSYAASATRRRNTCGILVGVCLASLFAIAPWLLRAKPVRNPAPVDGGIIFQGAWSGRYYSDTPCSTEAVTGADIALLAEAKGEWEAVLHRKIATPYLKRSTCSEMCSSAEAFACANLNDYLIVLQSKALARSGPMVDLRTILMHEMGHLLRVPHIEEDGLMGPVYTVKLRHPTPFAIALAKEALREQ